MNLLRNLEIRGRVLCNEPLSKHTTFKIGGPVRFWCEAADLDDLSVLLGVSRTESLGVFLVGEGSNLLISEGNLDVVAVRLKAEFDFFDVKDGRPFCGAGRGLQKFILDVIEAGFCGLEFMAGIPGTIGGAVRVNAGSGLNGPWLSDFIERLKVCDFNGVVRQLNREDLRFGYRESNLKELIILEAEFNLKKAQDKNSAKKEYRKFLEEKRAKQELLVPSAGCIFKNPKGAQLNAAQLIEECGLKGKRIGEAIVSNKHANFIVNMGRASFNDVMALIALCRNEVSKRYNIMLETEVQILEDKDKKG